MGHLTHKKENAAASWLSPILPILDCMLIIFAARRGVPRDVHDGGPEEVLRRHEEDGEEETREGDPETPGNIIKLCFGAACVCSPFLPLTQII